MAKNSRGEMAPNGPAHGLAVSRYLLRRGPMARQLRAQGQGGWLNESLIALLTEHEEHLPPQFDLELKELLAQQASVAA